MYDDEDFDADEAAREDHENYLFDKAHDEFGLAGMIRNRYFYTGHDDFDL